MAKSFGCEYCNKKFENKSKLELHKREKHNNKVCYFCGEEFEDMPFKCKYCGKRFCSEHRLPENHNCTYEKGAEKEEKWFEEKEGEEKTEEETTQITEKIKKFGWVKLAIIIAVILTILRIFIKFI